MIEIRVTKEISDYEPKLLGPFTIRQGICLMFCVPVCYFIIRFASRMLTLDVAAFLCFIPAGIAYAFGWAKPYGMKMETFIHSIFINRILAPTNRKYKTRNVHETILKQAAAICRQETEESAKKNKSRRPSVKKDKRKKRYKVSSEAIK